MKIKFLFEFIYYFAIVCAIVYIIGAFIAWDVNPLHWWLFCSILGRILTIFLFIIMIGAACSVWSTE